MRRAAARQRKDDVWITRCPECRLTVELPECPVVADRGYAVATCYACGLDFAAYEKGDAIRAASKVSESLVPYRDGPGPTASVAKEMVPLREITFADYEAFRAHHSTVLIEGKPIPLTGPKTVKTIHPAEFKREQTTAWSFPDRGDWATHTANYRGNWSPYIVRNVLEWYSQPGDLVLDQMVGGGTTLVECKVMGRDAIGVDINLDAVMLTLDRLNFEYNSYLETLPETNIRVFQGDARCLDGVPDGAVDLIATHPPYANIIPYSKEKPVEGDLSQVRSLDEFFNGVSLVADESFRVLKPGGHAAILIGDTHKHAHFVPISYRTLEMFLRAGFVLREDIIKEQWHTQTMRGRWHPRFKQNFLLTYHEHLFIFRKLREDEKRNKFKASSNWHHENSLGHRPR